MTALLHPALTALGSAIALVGVVMILSAAAAVVVVADAIITGKDRSCRPV